MFMLINCVLTLLLRLCKNDRRVVFPYLFCVYFKLSAPDKFSCSGFLLLDGVREPAPVSAVIPKPAASRRPLVFLPSPSSLGSRPVLTGDSRRGLYPYYSPFWAVIILSVKWRGHTLRLRHAWTFGAVRVIKQKKNVQSEF